MSSAALDPKLEAIFRLFTGDLEEFFFRDVLPKARLYSADTSEISAMIDALPQDARDEQSRVARDRELHSLEVLLERVRLATRIRAHHSFRQSAQAIQGEQTRKRLARAFVEQVSPLIRQLLSSFDVLEQAERRATDLERWLVSQLQRIADKEILQEEPRSVSRAPSTSDAVASAPEEQPDRKKLELRKELLAKVERGQSLTYPQTAALYDISARSLSAWINAAKLKKSSKRGWISAESIKANPPVFSTDC